MRVASSWIRSGTPILKPMVLPKSTPKSSRLSVALASAPQNSFFFMGWSLHWKLLILSVTVLLTPCSVSVPSTSVGVPFWNFTSLPV